MSERDHTYTCEVCGGTFTDDSTEEERMAEAVALFGAEHMDGEETASVCDDCHKRVLAWAREKGLIPVSGDLHEPGDHP